MAPLSDFFHQASVAFVADQEITTALVEIIQEAKEKLILVFAYHNQWLRLRDEIALATKRNVSVKMYYRPDTTEGNPAAKYEAGIEAIAVARLHSKVYANERVALITSMNLTQFSALNSRETGLLIRDEQVLREIEDWVSTLSQDMPNNVVLGSEGGQVTAVPLGQGFCIGCEGELNFIEFNSEKPFCSSAGHNFSRDSGFRCHKCGNSAETNHDAPFCPMHTGYCIGCKVIPKVIEFNPEKPFCSSAGHDFSTATGFRCHKCGESAETNRESPLCPVHGHN